MFHSIRRVGSLAALLVLFSVLGCGADNATTVSAPPPEMTPEQKAELAKKQNEHYAAPSNAERMQSSN